MADVLVGSDWKRLDDRDTSNTVVSHPFRTWKARKAIKDGGELLLCSSIHVYQQTRPVRLLTPARTKCATKAKRADIGNDISGVSVNESIEPKLMIPSDFDERNWEQLPRLLPRWMSDVRSYLNG